MPYTCGGLWISPSPAGKEGYEIVRYITKNIRYDII
jgi:hypothetical protein